MSSLCLDQLLYSDETAPNPRPGDWSYPVSKRCQLSYLVILASYRTGKSHFTEALSQNYQQQKPDTGNGKDAERTAIVRTWKIVPVLSYVVIR